MAYVLTGRTGTRTGSGSFVFAPAAGNSSFYNATTDSVEVYGATNGSTSTPLISITGSNAFGNSTGSVSFCGLSGSTNTGTPTTTATWSYTFDWAEWANVLFETDAIGLNPGTRNGEWGFRPIISGFSGGPNVGGSYTVTLTIGGTTVTVSGTITSAMAAFIVYNDGSYALAAPTGGSGYGHSAQLLVTCDWVATIGYSPTISAGITGTVDGIALGWPGTYNQGSTGTTPNVFCSSASGIAVTVTNFHMFYQGSNSLNQNLPVQYNVNGQAVTITGTEPNTLKANAWAIKPGATVYYTPPTPLGSYTFHPAASTTFTLAGAIAIAAMYLPASEIFFNPYVQFVFAPGPQGFSTLLDTTDATTYQECGGVDNRLLARFPIANGPHISQSSTIVLDPCNSLTVPGTWTGATVSGGHLHVDTSSSTVAQGSYSPALVSRQGRYLAFSIQPGTANAALTIVVQSVKGNVTYVTECGPTGSATNVIVDLCLCPSYPGPDYQTSRYNLPVSGSSEGPTWGANIIEKVTLTFPGASGIYLIEQIAIVVKNPPILSTTVAQEAMSSDGANFYFVGPVADVDGRRALEQVAETWPPGPGSTYYTIANMISALDPGWTGSWTPGTQWYVPNPANVSYLGGGGATFMGTTIQKWFRSQWNQSDGIPIQMMVDGIYAYPGMGDICNGGGIDGSPFVFYIYKILRGAYQGLVANSSPSPIVGAAVTASIGSYVTGSGITDSIGRFFLGAPGSYPIGSDTPPSGGGNIITSGGATLTDPIKTRQDRRIGIKGALSIDAPWIVQDDLGHLHVASVVNGDVLYQRSNTTTNAGGWATENVVTSYGDVISARMEIDPSTMQIHMLVTRFTSGAYSVYVLLSDSDGASFTTGVLLASSSLGASVWKQDVSSIGYTWFEYNSGTSGLGTQKAQFSPGAGQAFGSVFTLSDDTMTAISIADGGWCNIVEAKIGTNELTWCPILAGQTVPTPYISADQGKTWQSP